MVNAYLLDGVTRHDKEYPKFQKGKEFLEQFKIEVSTIRKFWDLESKLVAQFTLLSYCWKLS
jgi:hypothetical protein